MSTLLTDVRHSLRLLARRPLFAAAAILSLAAGLGVNTALFSISSALLLQLPPAGDPTQLVRVYDGHHSPMTYDRYRFLKERADVFSHLVGDDIRPVSFSLGGDVERAQASVVSGDYFAAMRVRPALGRFFARERDDVPAPAPEVVVSWRFYQSRLGADPSIVGRTIRLNDQPFVVRGVAPEGFTSALTLFAPDVFVPMGDTRTLLGAGPEALGGGIYLTGRLRPGVTAEAAEARVAALARQLALADSTRYGAFTAHVAHARGINAELQLPLTVAAGALQVVALLVLLVACANVGNLLLTRNASRRRELGIRAAIGATRRQLVRQLMTESALLAVAGVGVALLMTWWAQDVVNAALPAPAREVYIPVSMNGRMVVFAMVATALAIVVAGLAPALQAISKDVSMEIRGDAGLGSAGASRTRRTFLFAQVALTTVLLAVAGLFGRGLQRATQIDSGYPTARIADVTTRLTGANVPDEQLVAFWARAAELLGRQPWAERVSVVSNVPLTGSKDETLLWFPGDAAGKPTSEPTPTQFASVSPNYFAAMQVPLRQGRMFSNDDRATAPRVAIVNETFARQHARGQPLGQRVSLSESNGPWVEIVGVVKDLKYSSLGEGPTPFVYFPLAQFPLSRGSLQVEVRAGTPLSVVRREAIAAIHVANASVPPPDVDWVSQEQRIALLPTRLTALVLGSFGTLALLLASVGIFGVAAFAVAQRTREIGVRSALGAPARAIVATALGETARTVGVAAVVGVAVSIGLGVVLRSQLYGLGAFDPVTFLGVPVVLVGCALGASYVPIRRALRVDPAEALRG